MFELFVAYMWIKTVIAIMLIVGIAYVAIRK